MPTDKTTCVLVFGSVKGSSALSSHSEGYGLFFVMEMTGPPIPSSTADCDAPWREQDRRKTNRVEGERGVREGEGRQNICCLI
ncbi:hypothetical protein SRHO_G00262850 [Serrasalmus rhombeus]